MKALFNFNLNTICLYKINYFNFILIIKLLLIYSILIKYFWIQKKEHFPC